jgi:hypothetical protein
MWAAQTTSATGDTLAAASRTVSLQGNALPILMATDEEINAHHTKLQTVAKASGDNCLWLSPID